MKKAIALLLALVMVFALCACGGGDKGTADNGEKVVKIGVFEPASGDSGAGGKQEQIQDDPPGHAIGHKGSHHFYQCKRFHTMTSCFGKMCVSGFASPLF